MSAPSSSKIRCPACNTEQTRLKNVGGIMLCDNCASKKFSDKVKKALQESYEKQIEHQKKEAYNRRILLTKQAQEYQSQGRFAEAIQLYEKYIDILVQRFKTPKEKLHLHLFDLEKDAPEILLVTAVFWELAKLYDRVQNRQHDFQNYLNKYVEFSLGTSHMILSAETLRKFLKRKDVRNRKEFQQAHNIIREKLPKCFIATALLGPQDPFVATLREYRDEVLLKRLSGRLFVFFYYKISPPVAQRLALLEIKQPLIHKIFKKAFLKGMKILPQIKN